MVKWIKKIIKHSYLTTILMACFLIVSSLTPFWNTLLANVDNSVTTHFINTLDWLLWTAILTIIVINFTLLMVKMNRVISKKVAIKEIANKQYVHSILNFIFSVVSLILVKVVSIMLAKMSFGNDAQLSDSQNNVVYSAGILVFITFVVLLYILMMYARTGLYANEDQVLIDFNTWITTYQPKTNDAEAKAIEKNLFDDFRVLIGTKLAFNKKTVQIVVNNQRKNKFITTMKMSNDSTDGAFLI